MRVLRVCPILGTAVAVGGVLVAATPAAAAPAAAAPGAPSAAPAWHVAKTVAGSGFPYFTAVTASSPTSGWAFTSATSKAPTAYQLSGSTWSSRPFPGTSSQQVVAAASSSSTNAWAFTSKRQALRRNGTGWTVMKTFGRSIGSGVAISSTDVWVFGEPYLPGAGLGAWKYNGSTWTQPSGGSGLLGASALSPASIWAYGSSRVAHWNGSSWTSTSVASLLPKKTQFGGAAMLRGICAISASNVYAVGAGGLPDGGGPLVLLHYNGVRWSRVTIAKISADPTAVVPDGSGGLWIPTVFGAPISSGIEHYSLGALSNATLPYSPAHLALFGAVTAPGSAASFAFGFIRTSFSSTTSTAVILRYGG